MMNDWIGSQHYWETVQNYEIDLIKQAMELVEENDYKDVLYETEAQCEPDIVHNPNHYTQGGIECIDYLESTLPAEQFVGFLRGNVTKYLHRYKEKNGVEDLMKAKWYLERLIQRECGE